MKQIYVIGGANVDICARSTHEIRMKDSNLGKISISFGGVGRNIAENCALLKQSVHFVSCMAQDDFGFQLVEHCRRVGIDTSFCRMEPDARSSIYLAVLDQDNDMQLAINDMEILEKVDQKLIDPVFQAMDEQDCLVLDTNLNKSMIDYIVTHAKGMLALDPISVAKAEKAKDVIGSLSLIKPNEFEAAHLSGIEIVDEASASRCAQWFLDQGCKEVLISCAERGVIVASDKEKFWLSHQPIDVVNATGGGDCFLASYITKKLEGASSEDCAKFALSAAIAAITCKDTVNSDLSESLILDIMHKCTFERKEL